jgi:hypothetical protein
VAFAKSFKVIAQKENLGLDYPTCRDYLVQGYNNGVSEEGTILLFGCSCPIVMFERWNAQG